MQESCYIFEDEGAYPELEGRTISKLDNFTDTKRNQNNESQDIIGITSGKQNYFLMYCENNSHCLKK